MLFREEKTRPGILPSEAKRAGSKPERIGPVMQGIGAAREEMPQQPEKTGPEAENIKDAREWPKNYFQEIDPVKRKQLLAVRNREDDSLARQLEKLFALRYRSGGKNGYSDTFLQSWLRLRLAAEELDHFFGLQRGRRTAKAELKNLCLDEASAFSDDVMYREMCNLAACYITLCLRDTNYTAVLWGLGKKNGDKIRQKIELDLERIGEVLPKYLDMNEEFQVLTRAVSDMKQQYLRQPQTGQ